MVRFNFVVRPLTACCCIALQAVAFGHDGPEHEIQELTERIAKEGESADLLLKRAVEYGVMGKNTEATKDLERALSFEANSPEIQGALSRAYFVSGKTNEALQTVTSALKKSAEASEYASLLMVRVDILRARHEYQKALDDADNAILKHPHVAEWYLTRSQLQARLKLHASRVEGLRDGIKQTGSGVLEAEWIDALIDDEQHSKALEKIEAELKASRLQSSWLIRRAKVRLATGREEEGKSDLEAAIAELNLRIGTASPDPSLLADRGRAYDILGKKEDARKDYQQAKEKGVADDWLSDRIAALKEQEK